MTAKKPSRDADDQAIEALCWLLDRSEPGNLSGLGSRSGLEATRGEPWSAIIRRRIANKYGRASTVGRAMWMYRHFHVRRLLEAQEGDPASAAYVARLWNRETNSVLDNATRKQISTAALEWIDNFVKLYRQPFPSGADKHPQGDAAAYRALDVALEKMAREFSDDKSESSPSP